MLVREEDSNKKIGHVEFVSYTGKYPNLCRGILTLKIDGETVTFGNSLFSNRVDYPKFWSTGGSCHFSHATHGEWYVYESEIPTEYKGYAAEIEEVFNKNVPYGCCGGCL